MKNMKKITAVLLVTCIGCSSGAFAQGQNGPNLSFRGMESIDNTLRFLQSINNCVQMIADRIEDEITEATSDVAAVGTGADVLMADGAVCQPYLSDAITTVTTGAFVATVAGVGKGVPASIAGSTYTLTPYINFGGTLYDGTNSHTIAYWKVVATHPAGWNLALIKNFGRNMSLYGLLEENSILGGADVAD